MTLHPTMKRRLHERLHPLIGDEEADALLEEISPPDPVTRGWLQERFDQVDQRFEQVDRRFEQVDRRFEQVDQRFDQVDRRLDQVDRRLDQVDRRLERVDDRFGHVDERFGQVDEQFVRLDERFSTKEVLDVRFAQVQQEIRSESHRVTGEVHQALIQQTHRVYGAAGLFALLISIVDRVWG